MANSLDIDKTCIKTALLWAQLSKATRKKVGAVLYKDGTIISIGFNGTPTNFDNVCEIERFIGPGEDGNDVHVLETKPEVLHAESNAILKIAKSTQSCNESTLYVTCSPCMECAKLIIQAGIKRVVYGEIYRNTDGLELLKKAKIIVDYLEI